MSAEIAHLRVDVMVPNVNLYPFEAHGTINFKSEEGVITEGVITIIDLDSAFVVVEKLVRVDVVTMT